MNNIKKSIIQSQKKVETHTVSFDTELEIDPIIVADGSIFPSYRLPAIFQYNLEGWYTDSELTQSFDIDNTAITSDLTLYAKFYDGEALYTTPGTYSWTAPTGVNRISVVCVGAGGSSGRINSSGVKGFGGAGGALGYKNNIEVTPGESYTVVVGSGGEVVLSDGTNASGTYEINSEFHYRGNKGGQSYFNSTSTVKANGGD
jgi:hypothetical protein